MSPGTQAGPSDARPSDPTKELIQLPRYGQSRLYERIALAVAVIAVAIVGATAAIDDAEARTSPATAGKWNATIPTAPDGTIIPEPDSGEMLTPSNTSARTSGKRQGEKHVFPLPARHTYGDGFGAGRGHKGQDVFAKCGKKIIAARGGVVQTSSYQSSAGNYVVIDGRGTEWDYVYMHLRKRGLPKTGERIGTGDLIGFNGDTGNASGCHLHFEMWDPTGWYEGGRAKPPTKFLQSWDAYS